MSINERFAIDALITDIGESVQVVEKSNITFNTRGDISGATYTYTNTTASVQLMSAEDLEVQEGVLKPGDIIAYFDYNTANSISGALNTHNIISGSFFEANTRREWEIKEVIQNLGHYEVHASKL